ncbi:hypothetical protein JX265_006804 [Neoarthrinium moseri]|uniref:Cytochrome P450 n=1 Tax=Neoarthrinium moseri TaxID=1658444 RepID=A0A9Q0ANQ7_9PEZI|nr:hypothetical protein JX265_006804 [Neoarthrinium moseri]
MDQYTSYFNEQKKQIIDQISSRVSHAEFTPVLAAQGLVLLGVLFAVYRAVVSTYRLRFHPLSAFPGPREAAVSDRWLYKLSKGGRAEIEFDRLHRELGVQGLRIGPNDLHITDVSLYKVIYSQKTQYLKEPVFYNGFNAPHSVFAEDVPALHKERRKLLNPFFSKAGILRVEGMVGDKVHRLQRKIEDLTARGHPIRAGKAFRCLTVDLITDYAFAGSRNLIENSDDDFNAETLVALDTAAVSIWDSVYQPVARKMASIIPNVVISMMSKELGAMIRLVEEAAQSYQTYKKTGDHKTPVVFDALRSVKSDHLVVAEAVDILVAGSDTTAFTLTCGIWYIAKNPHIKRRLVEALVQAFPDPNTPMKILDLEAIPYLAACIRESLRMASPVQGRLPRIVPGKGADPLIVDGKVVPPGTVVGISSYTMHRSPEVWGDDVLEFNPDRWMGEEGKHLDSYLVTFSKGIRSCIGQNLAFAELFLTMGMLYRNFEITVDPISDNFEVLDFFTLQVPEPGLVLHMKKIT